MLTRQSLKGLMDADALTREAMKELMDGESGRLRQSTPSRDSIIYTDTLNPEQTPAMAVINKISEEKKKEEDLSNSQIRPSFQELIDGASISAQGSKGYCQGITYSNGESYKGHMLNNQFHGQGNLTFAPDDPQGRKEYVGLFEKGQFQGNGTVFYKSGDKCQAIWVKNEMFDRGKYCGQTLTKLYRILYLGERYQSSSEIPLRTNGH